jgi:chemosensory pili system protein ChpA (sensor histidine kinase/response regulator)
MSAALQSCIKNKFMDDLDTARRIAHTLKGAANVVGIRGVANMTHQMEDILDILFKYNTVATGSLAEVLLATADCLEGMCETLLGQGDAPADAVVVLQSILDWANHLDEGGKAALEKMATEAPVATPASKQEMNADSPAQPEAASKSPAKDKPEAEEEQRSLRISYSLIDELMRLAGEHTILSGQIQEHTGNAVKHMHGVKQRSQYLHNLTQELEQLVDVRRVGVGQRQDTSESFDPLEMEEYNELHTVTHRLVEAVNDVYEHMDSIERELQSLSDANVDQGRMNGQQQEVVMQTRMVPVQSVVPRLQRSVRQACRLAGKQIELEVEGANTLIDNDILSSLIDPIMHLLRNAVDHGIEDTQERADVGKPAEALIVLSFTRRGDQIVVICQDDGRGLDYARIQSKALERNLLQAGQVYSREELAHIILSPGFSTRDEVTQLSGRGVGMDVVSSEVMRLKGVLNVSSTPNAGTRFEIVLPTSLLAAHALLVRVAEQTFVVTSHGVNEVLFAGEGELQHLGDEMVYRSGEDLLKVTTLASLLNMPNTEININEHHVLMLVEENLGRKVAILIDEVVDSRDIVIKPLSNYFPKTSGVVGATILGDGSAVTVLDLPGLARTESQAYSSSTGEGGMGDSAAQSKVSILVVDDSLSTRRSLSQFVEDMGIAVETAKDGMEAVEAIRRNKPTLVLADMEMPRMNGLELTSHIRSQAETQNLPVIMITSRATDKHRQLAMEAGVTEYLNKPYSEEQLLQLIHTHLQQS